MFEVFGIPSQALFGQLLIGLINGSFYALLSLGLAVIFGMLNVINFAHGAQYMMGAFAAYLLLQYLGLNYWAALVVVPLLVGASGIVVERLFLQYVRKLDHLYGLILTFGLALVIEGFFRNQFGSSGEPYQVPDALQGGHNLGFMFLPNYRAWVIVFLAHRMFRHVVRHRAHAARLVFARRDRKPYAGARLRYQCSAHGDADLWFRRRPCGAGRRDGGADL